MRALAAQAKDAEAQAIMMRLAGGFSGIGGGPFYGTGYYGGGGLGLVIVILLILILLGRL
jgi:hypothetical protein